MNIFYPDHKTLLEALLKFKVDFVLIGGYAVNYYGYNRVTGDMDIWLKPTNENKRQLLVALTQLDFDQEGISTIENLDFTKPQKFFIGEDQKPDKTKFLTHISGIHYDLAKQN